MPAYQELLGKFKNRNGNTIRAIILDAAKPYLISALYRNLNLPVIVITSQPENAKKLYEQISLWCDSKELNIFSEPDILPYQRTITDFSLEQERLQVLSSLSHPNTDIPPLIISSVPALIQKTTSKDDFILHSQVIESGSDIEPLSLMKQLVNLGYQVENIVEVPGIISRRGGIIDIFPPTSELPVRLEFFGNTIESIRLFDPSSQRSQKLFLGFRSARHLKYYPCNLHMRQNRL